MRCPSHGMPWGPTGLFAPHQLPIKMPKAKQKAARTQTDFHQKDTWQSIYSTGRSHILY